VRQGAFRLLTTPVVAAQELIANLTSRLTVRQISHAAESSCDEKTHPRRQKTSTAIHVVLRYLLQASRAAPLYCTLPQRATRAEAGGIHPRRSSAPLEPAPPAGPFGISIQKPGALPFVLARCYPRRPFQLRQHRHRRSFALPTIPRHSFRGLAGRSGSYTTFRFRRRR
jgi:hypothetical protein